MSFWIHSRSWRRSGFHQILGSRWPCASQIYRYGFRPLQSYKGFWFTHMEWMLIRPRRKLGPVDVSDLVEDEVVQWQQRWYFFLVAIFAFIVPIAILGDWVGLISLLFISFDLDLSRKSPPTYNMTITEDFCSLLGSSIIWRTGLVKVLSVTNIRLATIYPPLFPHWEKVTTIFTSSSLWIIGTESCGTIMILPNGLSDRCKK